MTDSSWHLPDPQTQPEFYADVPLKRLLAWGVDTVVILIATLLILPFTAFTGLFFLPLLFLTVSFAYRVVTIARSSATWGMRLLAIEFRTATGARFDTAHALMHSAGYTFCWMVPLLQLASIILMATSERAQGLSDLALSTVVINQRAAS
ncbi:RDD family protein [Roseovarius aestuariivivens]|uniref:RDD family protein n=1 Tax=Roseovarius aestuariivivens TaxID=1888910 RepID=UPI001081982C|nr:RDD family protein [Roseovarius aestuariivivens]